MYQILIRSRVDVLCILRCSVCWLCTSLMVMCKSSGLAINGVVVDLLESSCKAQIFRTLAPLLPAFLILVYFSCYIGFLIGLDLSLSLDVGSRSCGFDFCVTILLDFLLVSILVLVLVLDSLLMVMSLLMLVFSLYIIKLSSSSSISWLFPQNALFICLISLPN